MDVSERACSQAIKMWPSTPAPQDATMESLAASVLQQDALYPQALRLLAEGRLVIEGRSVRMKG